MGRCSDYKKKTNQENAQKSTGPTSEAGKSVSARNSFKHGFTARKMTPGESLAETEEALEVWISDLNPQGAHALALAQASFECKLRLDEISKAHSSRIALRACKADSMFADKVITKNERLIREFLENPARRYAQFRPTFGGADHFQSVVRQLQSRLEINQWGETETRLLMQVDGQIDVPIEPILASHLKCFDTRKKLYACYESACRSDGAESEIAQATQFSIDMQRDEFNAARDYIKTRLSDRLATLSRELEEWSHDYEQERAIRIDAAKFDASRSGALLERYYRDRLRDFVKTTHEAIAACAPPKPKRGDMSASAAIDPSPAATEPVASLEPPNPPPAEPSPPRAADTRRVSRNEPNNACSDDVGYDDVLPFTAALPTAPDPVDER